MANRKKDKKQGQLYVAGSPFKDLLPTFIKTASREPTPVKPVDVEEEYIEISNEVGFVGHLPDWPGDEEALEHDFGTDVDPETFNFQKLDTWKFPKTFLKDPRL